MQKKKNAYQLIYWDVLLLSRNRKKLHSGGTVVYGVDPNNSYSQATKKYSEKKKNLIALKTQ